MSLKDDALVIKNETQSGANTATRVGTLLDRIISSSGWASYADTTYTEGSPFQLLADTDTLLPNDSGSNIITQIPYDVTEFYDGSVITGQNGDTMVITIDFLSKPTSGATTYIETWLDITGGTGTPTSLANLYKRIISFPKGNGVERPIVLSTMVYSLDTWEANGAVVKVRANGTCDIYDIRYVITRTHKAV
jgi:hypothetical protein